MWIFQTPLEMEDEFGFSSSESGAETPTPVELSIVQGSIFSSNQEQDGSTYEFQSRTQDTPSTVARLPDVDFLTAKCGWLHKMSSKGGSSMFRKKWRRRWFSIQDTVIKYYHKEPTYGESACT